MNPDYLKLPDEEAAQAITDHIKQWDAEEPLRYAAIGLMTHQVWKRMLWQHVIDPANGFPCRSFARWVRVTAPAGYSTVYAAMRDVEALPDVPAADLAQIPQSNFKTLKQLSTAVRGDEKVLAVAKSGRTDELVKYIQKEHPAQHIEADTFLRVPLTETQMADVEDAIKKAMDSGRCDSRSQVIWSWAVEELLKTDATPLEDVDDNDCAHA